MTLPNAHPQRLALNDEVHARPPVPLAAPARLSFLAMLADASAREREYEAVSAIARMYNRRLPPPGGSYYLTDLGPLVLKYERHTEFARYKFIVTGECEDPFAQPAIASVSRQWIASLPGQLIMAAHVGLVSQGKVPRDPEQISTRLFGGNTLVGSEIGSGAGRAFTDFRIHDDGFSRFLVVDVSLTQRQAGRMVQRLLEIDTYRMMALLGLPVARELVPVLAGCERQLDQMTTAMASASEQDEPLLDRLTHLSATVESSISATQSRFSAAEAYHELVDRRIIELREQRIQGLQTFREFMDRRLAPAMQTCRWAAARERSLSEGVTRASQLLSTRVDITRERQNQALLASMDRRAKLQLRLQQTVEGLSVVAITYYVVSLIGYCAKAVKGIAADLNPDVVTALSVPLVAVVIALGVRRIRRRVAGVEGAQE